MAASEADKRTATKRIRLRQPVRFVACGFICVDIAEPFASKSSVRLAWLAKCSTAVDSPGARVIASNLQSKAKVSSEDLFLGDF